MNPMNAINHYRFAVTTTPLTCTPVEIQVMACLDAACTKTYNGDVTATLSRVVGLAVIPRPSRAMARPR